MVLDLTNINVDLFYKYTINKTNVNVYSRDISIELTGTDVEDQVLI